MAISEVESIRRRSRAGNSGPWQTDYAEMAKKTVLRRTLKLAPCSPELQRALYLDERVDEGEAQDLPNVKVEIVVDHVPEPEPEGAFQDQEPKAAEDPLDDPERY
jgi:recombination protein RecT